MLNFVLVFSSREAIAHDSILDMPDRVDWRNCKVSKEQEALRGIKWVQINPFCAKMLFSFFLPERTFPNYSLLNMPDQLYRRNLSQLHLPRISKFQ